MNSEVTRKFFKGVFNFFKNKKVQNVLVGVLFLFILFAGTYLRLQPLPNLVDKSTGDYVPLALDPFYFLRVSETLVANGGHLPAIDGFRYPRLNVGWSTELTPKATLFVHSIASFFGSDVTLNFSNVISPAVFFAVSLIVFFLLVWLLTKKKWAALISSGILTIFPAYIYRTLAGFSDHESIGMLGFFSAFLVFSYGLLLLEKRKSSAKKSVIFGLVAGFFTMFAIAGWGGGAKFLFMILPLSFLVLWLTKEDKNENNSFYFYLCWFFGILVSSFIFGYSALTVLQGYMSSASGIVSLIALGYVLVDFLISKTGFSKKLSKYKELFILGVLVVFGSVFYQIFLGNLFEVIQYAFTSVINPFGTGRVGLTVAENAQPYLSDWIAQTGTTFFCIFLFGCFIVGGKLAEGIKLKNLRVLFSTSFVIFVIGILFTRISASSIMNGENFLSKLLFFLSFLFLLCVSVHTYFKSDWKLNYRWVLIVAWMVPMLLAVRSAVRVFFAIVPFVSLMVPLVLIEIGKFARKTKDDLLKLLSFLILGILILASISTLLGFYNASLSQAKYQSPSYNADWQNAMSWVRENTSEGSIFLHWWDYGYWVQTGGNRPTVTDGGHANGFWDHLIARYVLTTPNPETAKSFMKTHNVSYLLIDSTDIGKYSAYSSIGDDAEKSDRASYLPTFISSSAKIQETSSGKIRIYEGAFGLDEDLVVEQNGNQIFLPAGRAALIGIFISSTSENYYQPIGVYYYNSNQYKIPIQRMYLSGKLMDFGSGVNATVYVYPNVENNQFDLTGAAMYLSAKTQNSLVAKLYLLDDPNDEYPELELVHEEGVYPMNFYYGGFRGPIRIWKVNAEEMERIIAREEFMNEDGGYGEFDNLTFLKN